MKYDLFYLTIREEKILSIILDADLHGFDIKGVGKEMLIHMSKTKI